MLEEGFSIIRCAFDATLAYITWITDLAAIPNHILIQSSNLYLNYNFNSMGFFFVYPFIGQEIHQSKEIIQLELN